MAKSKNPRGSRWSRPYEEVFSKLKSEGKVGEDGERIVNRKRRKRGTIHHDISETKPGETSQSDHQFFYEKGEGLIREGEVALQVKAEDEPPTLSFEDTTVQLAETSSNINQVDANNIESRDIGTQTAEAPPPGTSSTSEMQELKSMMQVMLSRFAQMSVATQANSTALIMLADEVRQSRARMDKIAEAVGIKREDSDVDAVKWGGIKMEGVDCELR